MPGSFVELVYVFLVQLSLLSVYVISYPAIKADGPSFLLLTELDRHTGDGMSGDQLRDVLVKANVVGDRLQELLDDRSVILENGRYRITGKGRQYLSFFLSIRRLFTSAPMGG